LPDDTEDTLQQRILVEEHRLFPAVLHALALGRVAVDGRKVTIHGGLPAPV
jgi:phosphoribosylglycinamide formyltransferase-1